MGLVREFKEFAVKGNAVDMAVGIIIGAAFGKIVTSLVNDVLMPVLGALLGGMDFKSFEITIKRAITDAAGNVVQPAVTVKYGVFANAVVDFLIVAFCLFMVVKVMNVARRSVAAG